MSKITTSVGTFELKLRIMSMYSNPPIDILPQILTGSPDKNNIEAFSDAISKYVASISIICDILSPIPMLDLKIFDNDGIITPLIDSAGGTVIEVTFMNADPSAPTSMIRERFLVYEVETLDYTKKFFSIKGINVNSGIFNSRITFAGSIEQDWISNIKEMMGFVFQPEVFVVPPQIVTSLSRKGKYISGANTTFLDGINYCLSKTIDVEQKNGIVLFRKRLVDRKYDLVSLKNTLLETESSNNIFQLMQTHDSVDQKIAFRALYEANPIGPEIPMEAFRNTRRIEYDYDNRRYNYEDFGQEFYNTLFPPPLGDKTALVDYAYMEKNLQEITGKFQKNRTIDDIRYPLNLYLAHTVLYSDVISGTVQGYPDRNVGQSMLINVNKDPTKNPMNIRYHGKYIINRIEHFISGNSYVNKINASRLLKGFK